MALELPGEGPDLFGQTAPPGSSSLSFSPFLSCHLLLPASALTVSSFPFSLLSGCEDLQAALFLFLFSGQALVLSWSLPPQTSTVACRGCLCPNQLPPPQPPESERGPGKAGSWWGWKGEIGFTVDGPTDVLRLPVTGLFPPSCLCDELDPRAAERT